LGKQSETLVIRLCFLSCTFSRGGKRETKKLRLWRRKM